MIFIGPVLTRVILHHSYSKQGDIFLLKFNLPDKKSLQNSVILEIMIYICIRQWQFTHLEDPMMQEKRDDRGEKKRWHAQWLFFLLMLLVPFTCAWADTPDTTASTATPQVISSIDIASATPIPTPTTTKGSLPGSPIRAAWRRPMSMTITATGRGSPWLAACCAASTAWTA